VIDQSANASHPGGEAFTLSDTDIEFINNLLLEEGAPMESGRLAVAVIRERLQSEAKRRARLDPEDTIYLPRLAYKTGQHLVFPMLDFARGTVVAVRPGENPEIGPFEVVEVQVNGGKREFAARLENHELNRIPLETLMGATERTPEAIFQENELAILQTLETRLAESPDIAKITDRWFPCSLLTDISDGHLNLAEAVLDVAGGGPLPTSSVLEHLELPSTVDPRLAAFSLEYALYRDERFDEVGPAGEMAWFLQRLEPPEVIYPPRRLDCEKLSSQTAELTAPLKALARVLDDEWGASEHSADELGEVSLTLPFPHWRVGTLPLNSRTALVFPHAHQATRIRFEFVDSETGERFPGWVVSPFRYVFGLADWYPKKGLLPGGILRLHKGDRPGEVILEAATRRPAREWVRTATASTNNQLAFTMQKQAVGVEYDELSVIAVDDPRAVDTLWLQMNDQKIPLERLVSEVFRELAKLNPQSTVHAQTLYCAVNVVRRLPPDPVFAELLKRPYYTHVGDLYYRFDEAKWTEKG
jgi:hypothetical protein